MARASSCTATPWPKPAPRRIAWPPREKLVFVHPYDDPRIIAGQGTIALEMLQDVPELDTLVVPVGGGGMIAGCAVAARGLKPDVKVIGVESAGYSAMHQLLAGEPVTVGGDTIAEGIAVRDIGKTPLAIARALVDRVLTVDEVAIEHAIALFLEVEKTVAEGAGAAGLAALLDLSAAFHRPQGRARAVRRQHRHPPAGLRPAARPGARRPHRPPAADDRRPAGPARPRRRPHRQGRRQHRRSAAPAPVRRRVPRPPSSTSPWKPAAATICASWWRPWRPRDSRSGCWRAPTG